MRFDPLEPENTSYFGNGRFGTNDVLLGHDENIYALNDEDQVVKVDTSARTISPIG